MLDNMNYNKNNTDVGRQTDDTDKTIKINVFFLNIFFYFFIIETIRHY